MIVVLGSRHDPVATALVARWPQAALCTAEDLVRPGWHWPAGGEAGAARWVVDGRVVDDDAVRGVFVRRATVHAQELQTTHPADRAYLAEEAHAFLVFVLARTRACVANPVVDGAFGDAALRPERWMAVAARCGLAPVPPRLCNGAPPRAPGWSPVLADAVAGACFGPLPARRKAAVVATLAALGLRWARFVFDGGHRLRTITTAAAPGDEATAALGRLLMGAPA